MLPVLMWIWLIISPTPLDKVWRHVVMTTEFLFLNKSQQMQIASPRTMSWQSLLCFSPLKRSLCIYNWFDKEENTKSWFNSKPIGKSDPRNRFESRGHGLHRESVTHDRNMVQYFAPGCSHQSESHTCKFFHFPNKERKKEEYQRWVRLARFVTTFLCRSIETRFWPSARLLFT